VHLREYANVVSWSQATTSEPPPLGAKSVQAPDELQGKFSFEALVAVSACLLPHWVVSSVIWRVGTTCTLRNKYCLCLPAETHPRQNHIQFVRL
jgi:hypothetical protein